MSESERVLNEVTVIRMGDRSNHACEGPMVMFPPEPDDLVNVTDREVTTTMTFQEYQAKYNLS